MTVTTLAAMADDVPDGATLAFGGKTLHRGPMAFVRELARGSAGDLRLVGLAKGMDVDLLCGLDRVAAVHYGYVGFEWLGLAPSFRAAAEAGTVDAIEGTCYTVATMLRGAKQGVPFLPVAGLEDSDLLAENPHLATVEDPFGTGEVPAVRALRPDVGVVHAAEADEDGNVRVGGADLTERLVARAAGTVYVTAERVVPAGAFEDAPERTTIPGFLVDGVAEVPHGAHPLSCPGAYGYDADHLRTYLERSREGDVPGYVDAFVGPDEAAYRERAVGDRADELAWDAPAAGPAGT